MRHLVAALNYTIEYLYISIYFLISKLTETKRTTQDVAAQFPPHHRYHYYIITPLLLLLRLLLALVHYQCPASATTPITPKCSSPNAEL